MICPHSSHSHRRDPAKKQKYKLKFPRLSAGDLEKHPEVYLSGRVPFVITDVMDDWPALKKWSTNYFMETYPKEIVDFYPNDLQNINHKPYLLSWEALLQEKNEGKLFKHPQYMQWRVPLKTWEVLQKDYGQLPDFMYTEEKWLDKCMPPKPDPLPHPDAWAQDNLAMVMPLRVVTVGNAKSGMFNHADAFHTGVGHFQVVGRKKWHICSPKSTHLIYGPGEIFTHEVDYNRHPLYAEAECGELITAPGEILYYPSEWWHNTLSLDTETISVATRYVDTKHYNAVWDALKWKCANPGNDIRKQWPGAAPPIQTEVCEALDGCLRLWESDLGGGSGGGSGHSEL
jgi:hypothetical protein